MKSAEGGRGLFPSSPAVLGGHGNVVLVPWNNSEQSIANVRTLKKDKNFLLVTQLQLLESLNAHVMTSRDVKNYQQYLLHSALFF